MFTITPSPQSLISFPSGNDLLESLNNTSLLQRSILREKKVTESVASFFADKSIPQGKLFIEIRPLIEQWNTTSKLEFSDEDIAKFTHVMQFALTEIGKMDPDAT